MIGPHLTNPLRVAKSAVRWPLRLAAALVLVCAANGFAAEPPFTPPGGATLDSESLLVARRAFRLAQLPAPPKPPEIPAALARFVANPIDQFIVAQWAQAPSAGGAAPVLCDDATFVRRAYLDVIGLIPTFIETNRFLATSGADKREKLVDQLLERRVEYAAHWTPYWEDALASQNVLAQGGIPTRGNYRAWIQQSFEKNRPFDILVAELIDPTMPRRKGAAKQDILGVQYQIEYVRYEDHTVTLQTAANVGQVFLGAGMKCAACHDHFENKPWTQDRFLGFASLFAPADVEHIRCEIHSGRTVPARFPFAVPGAPQEVPAEHHARLHLAAQLITDPANPRFAKTIVNRLWKRYLGLGLAEPVDDYREDTPASHPELLEWLAHDFVAHGCDLQHTIRLILTSRTYQLGHQPRLADSFDASRPTPRYFRSPSLRRLTAEQFIDSVRLAVSGQLTPDERTFLDIRSTALARALGRPASRNEISTARPDDVAVVQSLELLNGVELYELIYTSAIVAKPVPRADVRGFVDRLYRTVLSRPATPVEKRAGSDFLSAAETPAEGVGDLIWALVVSPEFQYLQ